MAAREMAMAAAAPEWTMLPQLNGERVSQRDKEEEQRNPFLLPILYHCETKMLKFSLTRRAPRSSLLRTSGLLRLGT
eukprot:767423-Hanusia_phi.AAC.4